MRWGLLGVIFSLPLLLIELSSYGESVSMEEIVVTATRDERTISDSPILTQVVPESQLRENPYHHVGEVLDDVPGLYVSGDVRGRIGGYGKCSLSIQGMDRRRVLILIDGRPVLGSWAGIVDLGTLSLGEVKRIEVVKGPLSSLYGSGAIGGVVNIITGGSSKPPGYSTSFLCKVDPNWNSSIGWSHRIGFKRGDTSMRLNFEVQARDGYYLRSGEDQVNSPVMIGYSIGTNLHRPLTSSLSLNFDGALNLRRVQRKGLNLSYADNFELDRFSLCPALRCSTGNVKLTLSLYTARCELENYQTYIEYEDRVKRVDELRSRPFEATKNILGFEKGKQLPGLRRQDEKLTRLELQVNGGDETLRWVAGGDAGSKVFYSDNISGGEQRRKEVSLFAQAERTLSPPLSLLGGIRYEYSDAYGSDLSPKLAVMGRMRNVFKERDSLILRSSLSKGYRAPDFKELYYDLPYSTKSMAIIGGELLRKYAPWEPKLKPEASLGITLGPEYIRDDRLRIYTNFFWTELWNALQFVPIDPNSRTYRRLLDLFPRGKFSGERVDPDVPEYTRTVANIARVRVIGAEFYTSMKTGGWSASLSYTSLHAEDITTGERLEGKPTDLLKIKLGRAVRLGGPLTLHIGVSYRYSHGERVKEKILPDLHRLDAQLSLKIGSRYLLSVGVQNLTDEKSVRHLRQLPGRTIYVLTNINF